MTGSYEAHTFTPISPDLHCDISASLAHRSYTARQPRRQWKVTTWFGPSPVTRARDYQTMKGRQSSVTSRCLVAIFRHCLSDQTPSGTATSPSIADCCGLLAPTVTPPRRDDATTRCHGLTIRTSSEHRHHASHRRKRRSVSC